MAKIKYNPDREGGWDISDEGEQVEKLNNDIDTFWALKKLPPKQREVIEMRIAGYSYKEIAEKMGVKESTILTHIKRATKKIKSQD